VRQHLALGERHDGRGELRVDARDHRSWIALTGLPAGENLGLARQAMVAIFGELGHAVEERRAVTDEQRTRRELPQAVERIEIEVHVALGRIDDDRAEARHHVAGDEVAGRFDLEAEVAAGVPGSVMHLEDERWSAVELDALPIVQPSVERNALRVETFAGERMTEHRHVERAPDDLDAADVIGMVVGEPDGADLAAEALFGHAQCGQQTLVLDLERRARIDEHAVPRAEQVGVGMCGRRQGRGGERQEHDARAHFDTRQRTEVSLGGVVQARRRPVGPDLGKDAQQMENRRRGDGAPLVESGEGGARRDPLALFALRRHDSRLAVLGAPLEEEEAVVEARRRKRRGEPAAGEAQARGVEGEAALLEPRAERLLSGELSSSELGQRYGVGSVSVRGPVWPVSHGVLALRKRAPVRSTRYRALGPATPHLHGWRTGDQDAGLLEQFPQGAGD